MAGLKELRTRIDAIKSTQKITSAMKMVAASRLRRVQILVDKNQGYSENLRRSALRVKMEIEAEEKAKNIRFIRPMLLQAKANPQKYTLYVLSSDRGLCGAYNSNAAKCAAQRINELQKAGKSSRLSVWVKRRMIRYAVCFVTAISALNAWCSMPTICRIRKQRLK